MIQELLGDAGLLVGERKISFSGGIGVVFEGSPSSSSSSSPSPSLSPVSSVATTTITSAGATTAAPSSENLRCPRCDSSNTKFCYYNNYNLTQPRHFCKTCRRYWTKGGALRNIPIGGGCRKNKSTSAAVSNNTSSGKSTGTGKAKTTSSSEIIKSLGSGFNQEQLMPSNTVLWGSPQNSQLLALLRGTQNPNPNPMSNSNSIKDEGPMIGSHVHHTESVVATGALNARNLGVDPMLGQVPIGLFGSLCWRNNQHQLHYRQQNQLHHQPQQQSSLQLGEIQRVRSSSNHHFDIDHSSQGFPLTSNSSLPTMEPAPGSGGELGYWNPPFSWSDPPTSNASFP